MKKNYFLFEEEMLICGIFFTSETSKKIVNCTLGNHLKSIKDKRGFQNAKNSGTSRLITPLWKEIFIESQHIQRSKNGKIP